MAHSATEPGREELPIKGARGKVEIVGTLGPRFRVLQDGVRLRPKGGVRSVAMRSGNTVELVQRGFLPGFQSLWLDGKELYRAGADTPTAARVAMFTPFLLIPLNYVIGAVLGVALVFLNIWTVKNPAFPNALRIALPIANTLAGGLALVAIVAATKGT